MTDLTKLPDTPAGGENPELNDHPVIRGALVLIDVHGATLRRIEEGARYYGVAKSERYAGLEIDVTDEVKRLTVENLEKARDLIERVRRAGVVSDEAERIAREIKTEVAEKIHPVAASAEHAAEEPDDIVQLPGDRE